MTAEAVAAPWWEGLGTALNPIEARPRVVGGIEAVRQATRDGTPYVILHNPLANTYVKLDPREYDLVPLMDGTRSVKALVIAYFRRHGVLALPRVAGLVGLLREHQFLTEPARDAYAELGRRLHGHDAAGLPGRLARGFVQSELAFGGVDARFDAWYRAWGRLFFTRAALLLGALVALAGPLLFLTELRRDRYPLFAVGGSYLAGFLLLSVLQLLALSIHELGHGLAVKRAGRRVHRAGLLLYYGLPAAFVDTTDIWMAPRRQRLLVSLAGPWTGLLLGGACALGAVLLPQGALGGLLFAWSFVFLLNALVNFNPLLELDGYYLLVDLVEKPMLRARAFGFVRGPLWAKLRRRARLSGEERFFAAFGLAAAAYSAFALSLAALFWEQRLFPLLRRGWESGEPPARLGVALILVFVLGPLLLAAWALARRIPVAAGRAAAQARGRASARWHREALAALRAVPLWAGLPEARALEAARALRAQDVPVGTEVVRQGEPGDRFYLIESGAFEVLVNGVAVNFLRRGDYFGERALINDAPRAATVVAVEPARVYWLGRRAFDALFRHDLAMRARLESALAYRDAVARMPLLRDLSPAELDLLLTRLQPAAAAPGEAIVRQGEPGDRFYLILDGRVEVERDGRLLATLGSGEAFGEIALLLDVPRTATVRALVPTHLLALEAADFRDLLAGYCGRSGELERLTHLRLASHSRLDQVVAGYVQDQPAVAGMANGPGL